MPADTSGAPITEEQLWNLINEAWQRMNWEQRRIWEVISTPPQKWQQIPYGSDRGGFWVVAIIGNTVLWFNDIEEGFNRSTFTVLGTIDKYYCNQDDLERQVQNVINHLRNGYDSAGYCGPPMPLDYTPI